MSSEDRENDLVNVYIAGVFDAEQAIRCTVRKEEGSLLGYRLVPKILFRTKSRELIHVVVNWLRDVGVSRDFNRHGKTAPDYEILIENRDDLRTVITALRPYLIVQDDDADVIMEEILPRIEGGIRSEEKFIETVGYADLLAQPGTRRKYDTEFFREEFGIPEPDEDTEEAT